MDLTWSLIHPLGSNYLGSVREMYCGKTVRILRSAKVNWDRALEHTSDIMI